MLLQVNSAYAACDNLSFNSTLDIESICNRVGPIIVRGREKTIVKPLQVPFVQVHMVTGASMTHVNYTTDMFFVHWKKVLQRVVNKYQINKSVKERLGQIEI